MNNRNSFKRHDELVIVAQRLGANLPLYPTPEELAPVVRALMLETHCMRPSAHHAIVAGILRPKRRSAAAAGDIQETKPADAASDRRLSGKQIP